MKLWYGRVKMIMDQGLIVVWRRVVFLILLLPSLGHANGLKFSYGLENFRWEEFDIGNGGSSLLTETGWRHVLQVNSAGAASSFWDYDFTLRGYLGQVDYDGRTQDGVPVTSDTDYLGSNLELAFLRYISGDRSSRWGSQWLLELGLGYDGWRRELLGGTDATGRSTVGYTEDYRISYSRLGAVYRNGGGWQFRGGMKYPFNSREMVRFSDFGYDDPELEPKGELSYYAALAYQVTPALSLDLSYDSYRFGQSDWRFLTVNGVSVDDGDGICGNAECVAQPESHQDTVTLTLNLHF